MQERNQLDKVVIYQAKNGEIKFRGDFKHETIWATQKQMASIFNVDVRTINEHLKNIFKIRELNEKSVIRNFRITASDGKTYNTKHYNLDTIISVGYRVNSKRATEFRKWATKVLKSYLLDGFVVNKSQIKKNHEKFLTAVEDVRKLLPENKNVSTESILELITAFADTWFSLESYDENKLPRKGDTKKVVKVQSEELYLAVGTFKKELIRKKQASELFAQEKSLNSLEGILGNVLQSIYGKDVYPSVEEKAAYLLYFIVKNHPFTDGNKRTGAFSFVWFLQKSAIEFERRITPQALTIATAKQNPTFLSF